MAALSLLAGCVGPGLEPPQEQGSGLPPSAEAGGGGTGGEPVGGNAGTSGIDTPVDASAAPLDGGVENLDAASDSDMEDDAGT